MLLGEYSVEFLCQIFLEELNQGKHGGPRPPLSLVHDMSKMKTRSMAATESHAQDHITGGVQKMLTNFLVATKQEAWSFVGQLEMLNVLFLFWYIGTSHFLPQVSKRKSLLALLKILKISTTLLNLQGTFG